MKHMFSVMAFVLSAAAIIALVGCGASSKNATNKDLTDTSVSSASEKVLNAIDSNEYLEARELYEEKIAGNASREIEVSNALYQRLVSAYDDFNHGEITYDEAYIIMQTIDKSELLPDGDVQASYNSLENLNKSKQARIAGDAYAAEGNYMSAYLEYANVITDDVDFSEVQELQSEAMQACTDSLIAEAEEAAAQNEYQEALEILEKGYIQLGNAGALDDEYEKINSDWLAYVLQKAEEAFAAGENGKDYSAAIQVLQQSGLYVEEIDAEIAYYQTYVPILLTSLEYTQKAQYVAVGTTLSNVETDVNGNTYEGSGIIYPTGGLLARDYAESDDERYVQYYLNAEYANLTGVIYRPYGSLSATGEWNKATTFKIYGDEVLLYEGPQITNETYDITEFDIDVTGVRNLKIVIDGVWSKSDGSGLYSRNPKLCVTNLMLSK